MWLRLGGGEVIKENEPRMWDDREYELVVHRHPTRAQRVSVGCRFGRRATYGKNGNAGPS